MILANVLAVVATFGIVVLTREAAGNVATVAIAAISATTSGAIAAVGAVIGRRSPKS
ncbi:hypothetical protein [Micromonospora sp. LA-10]|uniref:hypothetical protein n=1 Tax=Micromonospora sp. LA-10 TaxID=3446364 RepID=UPI003F6EDE51